MRVTTLGLVLSGILMLCGCGSTQSSDISVESVDINVAWGEQRATIHVQNRTDDLKFLTVEAETQFRGTYLNPRRLSLSHIILLPSDSTTIRAKVDVPLNYGTADVCLKVYDVVDTLDEVYPSMLAYEKRVSTEFEPPSSVLPYLEEQITMPPRVGEHPYFDSEFARIALLLLSQEKTPEEIAEITGAEAPAVQKFQTLLDRQSYAKVLDGRAHLSFPVITHAEAEDGSKLAERTATDLAALIEDNLPAYQRTIDSLIQVGAIASDTNAFLDPGSVLFRRYPVIAALSLWFDLGREFITRSAPLLIYDNTDPCNAHIPYYMYAVQGDDEYQGEHFYVPQKRGRAQLIQFGDAIRDVDCGEDFLLKYERGRMVAWKYAGDVTVETFVLDTAIVRPALNALANGADSLLWNTYEQLKDIALGYGHSKATFGARYWLWNLVATRTLDKLVDKGIVKRRGDGYYKFDQSRAKPRNKG